MMFTSFGAYGGRIFLRDPTWQYLLPSMAAVVVLGVLRTLARVRSLSAGRQRAFVTLGLATTTVWVAVILAHLPVGFPSGIPSPRYGFTMMLPTMIVACAGWLALWSAQRQVMGATLLLAALAVLMIAAVSTIQLFANTVCVRNPGRCLFTPVPLLVDVPLAVTAIALIAVALLVQYVRVGRRSSAPPKPPPRSSTT
jgi:hypothetical protein